MPCEAALGRLCTSDPFKNSPQLAAFLRYVVEAVLNGHAETIKAYTVAVDALGRPSNFDPIGDAIVRVEARRLRRALAQYYEDQGNGERIGIAMQPGSYVPTIAWRADAPADLERGQSDDSEPLSIRAHLAASQTILERGHSTLVRHQYLFARCHRNMAAVTHHVVGLRLHVQDARALVTRSRELVERSRKTRHPGGG